MKSEGEVALSAEIDRSDRSNVWSEYYQEFHCFSDETVRPGCHPRKLVHKKLPGKAIVLVHGLTDSPYYMKAIGDYFHETLGFNVYMPLLQGHGLAHPDGMAGVSLDQWKNNVNFAIQVAAKDAEQVSIGGLSTGGALSFYSGCTDPKINGALYLFSAAFGLYGGRFEVFGRIKEAFLRTPLLRLGNSKKPLAGSNPYRYDRVPLRSAAELIRLITEIDVLLKQTANTTAAKRIFSAWSEFDQVVSGRKLKGLKKLTGEKEFTSFIIPKAAKVEHACVVLDEPIYAIDSEPEDAPLEAANPYFAEMMAAILRFESAG
ncbi:MAG: alpha/beta hydrolase [Desulforhopalus sp.]